MPCRARPYLCFEYQGGEPTVNFDVIKFCVEYSREKNKQERKTLDHSVVTNMTYMNEEHGNWLIDNKILLCTSLDGPEQVHDYNRPWTGGGAAYASVVKWMKWFNARYVELGHDPDLWHIDALTTTTQISSKHGKEIVDEYVNLGLRNIHIRPLNPFGFATKTWRRIGYTMEEWLDYYEWILDYILELNREGVQIMEGTAATFLKKASDRYRPDFVDIRSPVGSGTGQICYGYDGSIFLSDEGRMVHGMGDDIFKIGHVDHTTWEEAANHPTVRAIATASYLDVLPQCESCWNAPYCGIRPLTQLYADGRFIRPTAVNTQVPTTHGHGQDAHQTSRPRHNGRHRTHLPTVDRGPTTLNPTGRLRLDVSIINLMEGFNEQGW